MRRGVLLVVCVLLGLLVGCGESFDEEGFAQVEGYAEDIVPAVETAVSDVHAGAGPEVLAEHGERIEEVNAEHLDGGFPEQSEIEGWMLNRSQGDPDDPSKEWTVQGEDLADSVAWVESASADLADQLKEGQVDEGTAARASSGVEDLRAVLFDE